MGLLDDGKRLLDEAHDAAKQHPDQVKQATDKAEHALDSATGGKFTDKIESAGQHAEDYLEN